MKTKKNLILDVDNIRKSINFISSHKLFSSIQRNSVNRDWIGYLYTKEMDYSSVLAWLLNPQEGHGLGDYFLKKLINQLPTTSKRNKDFDWEPYQISLRNINSAIVQTELTINTAHGKRKIDIAVIDPISQISIIIERKNGAYETNNQLDAYYNWAHENLQKSLNHHVFFVLSGYSAITHDTRIAEKWDVIDDQWICDALEEAIERDIIPQTISHSFKYLIYCFFGDWDEESDKFYKKMSSDTAIFRHEYHKHIDTIKNAKFIDGKNILKTTRSSLITDYLLKSSDSESELLYFIINNYYCLDEIIRTDQLKILENTITPLGFSCEFAKEKNHAVMRASLNEMLKDENGYWAAYLTVTNKKDETSDISGAEEKYHFEVSLQIHRTDEVSDDSQYTADQINQAAEALANQAAETFAQKLKTKFGKSRLIRIETPFCSTPNSSNADWLAEAAKWFMASWNDVKP